MENNAMKPNRMKPNRLELHLEKVRRLTLEKGDWLTAIEYADHMLLGDGNQCDCPNMGACPLNELTNELTNRRCYTTQLRDRWLLREEGFDPNAGNVKKPRLFVSGECLDMNCLCGGPNPNDAVDGLSNMLRSTVVDLFDGRITAPVDVQLSIKQLSDVEVNNLPEP